MIYINDLKNSPDKKKKNKKYKLYKKACEWLVYNVEKWYSDSFFNKYVNE